MSQRKAKQARRAARGVQPTRKGRRRSVRWTGGAAALVAAVVIGGVLAARGNGPTTVAPAREEGSALRLEGRSPITGGTVSLATYAGKPIVLNVWASWCTGCREEARDLARFAHAHPEAQVIGLDTQDNDGDARAFYREFGWTHPSIRDSSGNLAAKLGLQGLPTTIFLDERHRIVARIVGASNYRGFENGLRSARRASSAS